MDTRDVFISHSAEDREVAEEVCEVLESRGFACWIAPRDVAPGSNYAEEILDAIEGTRATVLILSGNSNASVHVRHEIERAVSKGKTIFPVRVEDVKPARAIELFVSSAQWIDAFHPNVTVGAGRLADAIARLNGMPVTTPVVAKPAARAVPKVVEPVAAPRRGLSPILLGGLLIAVAAAGLWFSGVLTPAARTGVFLAIEGPPKAEVTVDGGLEGHFGKEGKLIALTPGDHKLTIEAPNHLRYEKMIRVGTGPAERLEVTLPLLNVLELKVTPVNARVAINGKDVANGAPVQLRDGTHNIDVSASGYTATRQTVSLKGGQHQIVNIDLAREEKARQKQAAPARPMRQPAPPEEVAEAPAAPRAPAAQPEPAAPEPAPAEAPEERGGGFGEAFGRSFGESLGRNLGQGNIPGGRPPMPFPR